MKLEQRGLNNKESAVISLDDNKDPVSPLQIILDVKIVLKSVMKETPQ